MKKGYRFIIVLCMICNILFIEYSIFKYYAKIHEYDLYQKPLEIADQYFKEDDIFMYERVPMANYWIDRDMSTIILNVKYKDTYISRNQYKEGFLHYRSKVQGTDLEISALYDETDIIEQITCSFDDIDPWAWYFLKWENEEYKLYGFHWDLCETMMLNEIQKEEFLERAGMSIEEIVEIAEKDQENVKELQYEMIRCSKKGEKRWLAFKIAMSNLLTVLVVGSVVAATVSRNQQIRKEFRFNKKRTLGKIFVVGIVFAADIIISFYIMKRQFPEIEKNLCARTTQQIAMQYMQPRYDAYWKSLLGVKTAGLVEHEGDEYRYEVETIRKSEENEDYHALYALVGDGSAGIECSSITETNKKKLCIQTYYVDYYEALGDVWCTFGEYNIKRSAWNETKIFLEQYWMNTVYSSHYVYRYEDDGRPVKITMDDMETFIPLDYFTAEDEATEMLKKTETILGRMKQHVMIIELMKLIGALAIPNGVLFVLLISGDKVFRRNIYEKKMDS